MVCPSEKAVAEINENFHQMKNTYCAISKLEYLLEAVRLTYENIKDSRNPKKPMNDLGADGEGTDGGGEGRRTKEGGGEGRGRGTEKERVKRGRDRE